MWSVSSVRGQIKSFIQFSLLPVRYIWPFLVSLQKAVLALHPFRTQKVWAWKNSREASWPFSVLTFNSVNLPKPTITCDQAIIQVNNSALTNLLILIAEVISLKVYHTIYSGKVVENGRPSLRWTWMIFTLNHYSVDGDSRFNVSTLPFDSDCCFHACEFSSYKVWCDMVRWLLWVKKENVL